MLRYLWRPMLMYLKQETSKTTSFVGISKTLPKRAGSGSVLQCTDPRIWIRIKRARFWKTGTEKRNPISKCRESSIDVFNLPGPCSGERLWRPTHSCSSPALCSLQSAEEFMNKERIPTLCKMDLQSEILSQSRMKYRYRVLVYPSRKSKRSCRL